VLRRVGDRYLISSELSYFGHVALVTGEAGRAEALFAEGLAAARELGAPQMIAPFHWHLGNVAFWQGDMGRAAALYEEGVARSRERQDTIWIARNLAGLGRVAQRQGDTARAAALLQESLSLCTAMEHTLGVAVALHGLGLVAQARGDGRQAIALLRQSLVLCQQLSERLAIVECLESLALVLAEGQPQQAARLLGAATGLRAGMGAPLPLSARETYDRLLADLRARLGEATFLAAWDTGQGFSLDQAIAEALASTDPPPPAVAEDAVVHRPTTLPLCPPEQNAASRYHDQGEFRE
jgi:tetratricopeptide (TPR) repeat protein